ncbi:MAG: ABC transporter ATP-binding protein [Clostridia bacterium]|nr:ABC transporter ATP-binding protein [Clostridia bacterium]
MRVELKGIKKIYHDKVVLDISSLGLEKGKIYAVLGPNGSGKTTLLKILSGIEKASEGLVHYLDMEMLQEKQIAYMPQKVYMFDLTVLENTVLGLKERKICGTEAEKLAMEALEQVGMNSFSRKKARCLSGGEAQRVALARTLALGKELVLLDEPASATDIAGVDLVEKYICCVNEKNGSTIVFTTHNPSQAARIADEVIIMSGGRVVEKGKPSMVFNSPQNQETRDFLKSWRI